MQTLFICHYPSLTDLFREYSEVFTENEYKIARALIPEIKLIEVHHDNRIENDRVSKKDWRLKYE